MITLSRIPSDYRFASMAEWDYWNGGGTIPDSIWINRPDGGVDLAVPKTILEGYFI